MKNKTPYIFLVISLLLAISALVLLIIKPGNSDSEQETTKLPDSKHESDPTTPKQIETLDEPIELEETETVLDDIGVGLTAANPEELLERISNALQNGDMEAVSKLVGDSAFDADGFERLSKLAGKQDPSVRTNGKIREVGEITLNRLSRWELEFNSDEDKNERVYFELERNGNQWRIAKVILPEDLGDSGPLLNDPLGVVDSFIQAALKQDFEAALQYVDKTSVTEAKIAGLCIIFEEGGYRLRSSKPLRAMFSRDDIVGFIANITTADGEENAQISISLKKIPNSEDWKISEINLDRLLSEYAKRVGGDDVYYSPLVKNPTGGETLALYFEFDEDSINPRTRRQLKIVASLLKTDPAKKITLSGHTDSVGSDAYNDDLSAKRAQVVRDFLAESGVSAEQIVTVAKGASQPRRPNVTESGEDNPEGRRANRRTEIYLDF